jgi:DNA replication protein DnaC
MRVRVKGKEWNLKGLKDDEYKLARKLALKSGNKPLDQCPTCGGKSEEIPNSGGVTDFVSRTYKDKHGNEVQCDCQSQIALRARYLLANIGNQYQKLDWDDFTGEEKPMIDNYVENWEDYLHHGFGMELGGSVGIGKTFSATHIAKEMIKRNQSVYFIPFKDMVFAYEKEDEDFEEKFRDSTFLVIDEVTVPKQAKAYDLYSEKFEAMIRHRTNYDLPTIITTNVKADKLDAAYPRVYSLLSAKQVRVDFKGTDVREAKGNENFDYVFDGVRRPIT